MSRAGARGFTAVACILPSLLAAPLPAAGQDSRAEAIGAQQSAKAARLGTEGPSRLEKVVVWTEGLPVFGRNSGFYPWLESVYPGTGAAAGGGYVLRRPGVAHTTVEGGIGLHGSWFARAHSVHSFVDGAVLLDLEGRYTMARDVHFHGLGPTSARPVLLDYDYHPATVGATTSLRVTPWLALSGGYQWLDFGTEIAGPLPAPQGVPGLGPDLRYDVLRADARLDWRPSDTNSARGGAQRLSWARYFEARGRAFDFRQMEYEGIQLLPVYREQWVLAFRALATLSSARAGHSVPLVLMPTLGGAESLRGFKTRRYTDLNRLLLSAEYRWRPSRAIDMALFFDAGEVGARRSDLDLADLQTDWGFGIRFHGPTRSGIAFRAETARSHEGWEIIFSGAAAF